MDGEDGGVAAPPMPLQDEDDDDLYAARAAAAAAAEENQRIDEDAGVGFDPDVDLEAEDNLATYMERELSVVQSSTR